MNKNIVPIDELVALLRYEPENGNLYWRGNQRQNKVAGSLHREYRRIHINGRVYAAHRVCWALYYGTWPDFAIDHINGDKLDNKIENLRLAVRGINQQNLRGPTSRNKLGVLGVRNLKGRYYTAQIYAQGKLHHLGCFANLKDAKFAYLIAKRKYHEGCTT